MSIMVRKSGTCRVSRLAHSSLPIDDTAPTVITPFGTFDGNDKTVKITLKACPQCKTTFNEAGNRPLQDCCGHVKCRSCFIRNEEGCPQCREAKRLRELAAAKQYATQMESSGSSIPPLLRAEDSTGNSRSRRSLRMARKPHPLLDPPDITGNEPGPSNPPLTNGISSKSYCQPTIDFSTIQEITAPTVDPIYSSDLNCKPDFGLTEYPLSEDPLRNHDYSSRYSSRTNSDSSYLGKSSPVALNNKKSWPDTHLNKRSFSNDPLSISRTNHLNQLGTSSKGLVTRAQLKEIPADSTISTRQNLKRKSSKESMTTSPVTQAKVHRTSSPSTKPDLNKSKSPLGKKDKSSNPSPSPEKHSSHKKSDDKHGSGSKTGKFFRLGPQDREEKKYAAIANTKLNKSAVQKKGAIRQGSSKNKPGSSATSPVVEPQPSQSTVNVKGKPSRLSSLRSSTTFLNAPYQDDEQPSSSTQSKISSSSRHNPSQSVSTKDVSQKSPSKIVVLKGDYNASGARPPIKTLSNIQPVISSSQKFSNESNSNTTLNSSKSISQTTHSDAKSSTPVSKNKKSTETSQGPVQREAFNESSSSNANLDKDSSPEVKKKKKRSPVLIHDHITILQGDPPMYQCNVCMKKFKTKAHIKYHEFCQNGEKPFKCDQCGQGFIAKSHFEYHLRTHTGERPYVCPKCGKGFNQRGKVTRHMRSHTGEKPFVCQQCGRGFANAQALRSHFLIHTGERPFACQYCNKRFTGMTNLKKHVITHTGERPFMCPHCGKSFGLKWTLDLHLRTHSSERPYACDQCTRAFSNSKDLRRHLVIHSGERPFKCWICGTAFRRKDNLDRHIKNTHNQPKEVAKQLANEAAAEYLALTKSKNSQQQQQQQQPQQQNLNKITVVRTSTTGPSLHIKIPIKVKPTERPAKVLPTISEDGELTESATTLISPKPTEQASTESYILPNNQTDIPKGSLEFEYSINSSNLQIASVDMEELQELLPVSVGEFQSLGTLHVLECNKIASTDDEGSAVRSKSDSEIAESIAAAVNTLDAESETWGSEAMQHNESTKTEVASFSTGQEILPDMEIAIESFASNEDSNEDQEVTVTVVYDPDGTTHFIADDEDSKSSSEEKRASEEGTHVLGLPSEISSASAPFMDEIYDSSPYSMTSPETEQSAPMDENEDSFKQSQSKSPDESDFDKQVAAEFDNDSGDHNAEDVKIVEQSISDDEEDNTDKITEDISEVATKVPQERNEASRKFPEDVAGSSVKIAEDNKEISSNIDKDANEIYSRLCDDNASDSKSDDDNNEKILEDAFHDNISDSDSISEVVNELSRKISEELNEQNSHISENPDKITSQVNETTKPIAEKVIETIHSSVNDGEQIQSPVSKPDESKIEKYVFELDNLISPESIKDDSGRLSEELISNKSKKSEDEANIVKQGRVEESEKTSEHVDEILRKSPIPVTEDAEETCEKEIKIVIHPTSEDIDDLSSETSDKGELTIDESVNEENSDEVNEELSSECLQTQKDSLAEEKLAEPEKKVIETRSEQSVSTKTVKDKVECASFLDYEELDDISDDELPLDDSDDDDDELSNSEDVPDTNKSDSSESKEKQLKKSFLNDVSCILSGSLSKLINTNNYSSGSSKHGISSIFKVLGTTSPVNGETNRSKQFKYFNEDTLSKLSHDDSPKLYIDDSSPKSSDDDDSSSKLYIEESSPKLSNENSSTKMSLEDSSSKLSVEDSSFKLSVEDSLTKLPTEDSSFKLSIEDSSSKLSISDLPTKVSTDDSSSKLCTGNVESLVNGEIDETLEEGELIIAEFSNEDENSTNDYDLESSQEKAMSTDKIENSELLPFRNLKVPHMDQILSPNVADHKVTEERKIKTSTGINDVSSAPVPSSVILENDDLEEGELTDDDEIGATCNTSGSRTITIRSREVAQQTEFDPEFGEPLSLATIGIVTVEDNVTTSQSQEVKEAITSPDITSHNERNVGTQFICPLKSMESKVMEKTAIPNIEIEKPPSVESVKSTKYAEVQEVFNKTISTKSTGELEIEEQSIKVKLSEVDKTNYEKDISKLDAISFTSKSHEQVEENLESRTTTIQKAPSNKTEAVVEDLDEKHIDKSHDVDILSDAKENVYVPENIQSDQLLKMKSVTEVQMDNLARKCHLSNEHGYPVVVNYLLSTEKKPIDKQDILLRTATDLGTSNVFERNADKIWSGKKHDKSTLDNKLEQTLDEFHYSYKPLEQLAEIEEHAISKPKEIEKEYTKIDNEIPKEIEKESTKIDKEIPKEIEKEIPKEMEKEIPKETEKEIPKEAEKEIPKEIQNEIPQEIEKEIPKEIEKEIPKKIEQEIPKETEKEIPQEIEKEIAKEAEKEIPQEIEKEIPKELEKEIHKETEKEIHKETEKEIPQETEKEIPQETEKEIPKELEKEIHKETEKEIPQETEKEIFKEADKEIPKELEKEIPQETEKEIPQVIEKEIPQEIEKEIPKETEKEIPKETEKEIPQETEKAIPKETEKEIPKETEKEIPKETEKETLKETENEIPQETEKAISKETEKEIPKETEKEIPKETEKEIPKETEKEIPKEPEKEIPQEIKKEIPQEIKKEIPKEIEKEVSKEIEKDVSKEIEKDVSKEIEKEVSKEMEKDVSKELEKDVSKEIEKEVSKEIEKEVAKEKEKEISKDIEKEISMEIEKEISKEIEKEVSKEIEKEVSKEIEKEVSKEIEKEVSKEIEKEMSKEIEKEISKEIEKEVYKEIEKEVYKEIEKEVPKEIEKEVPKEIEVESPKPKKIEELSKSKEIKICSKPKEIEEYSKPKEVEECSKPKEIEECSKPKEIEECSKPKELEECSKPKEIEECPKPKEIEECSKPKEIEECSKPKEIEECSKPKEIKKDTCKTTAKETPNEIETETSIKTSKETPEETEIQISKEIMEVILEEIEKECPKENEIEIPKEKEMQIPKEIEVEYFNQNGEEYHLTKEEEGPKEIEKEIPKEKEMKIAKEMEEEYFNLNEEECPLEIEKEIPKEIEKEIPKEIEKEIPKEIEKEIPKEIDKETPKEIEKEIPKEIEKEIPKEVEKEIPKEIEKVSPKEIAKESPKRILKEFFKKIDGVKGVSKDVKCVGRTKSLADKTEKEIPKPGIIEEEKSGKKNEKERSTEGEMIDKVAQELIVGERKKEGPIEKEIFEDIAQDVTTEQDVAKILTEVLENVDDSLSKYQIVHTKLNEDTERVIECISRSIENIACRKSTALEVLGQVAETKLPIPVKTSTQAIAINLKIISDTESQRAPKENIMHEYISQILSPKKESDISAQQKISDLPQLDFQEHDFICESAQSSTTEKLKLPITEIENSSKLPFLISGNSGLLSASKAHTAIIPVKKPQKPLLKLTVDDNSDETEVTPKCRTTHADKENTSETSRHQKLDGLVDEDLKAKSVVEQNDVPVIEKCVPSENTSENTSKVALVKKTAEKFQVEKPKPARNEKVGSLPHHSRIRQRVKRTKLSSLKPHREKRVKKISEKDDKVPKVKPVRERKTKSVAEKEAAIRKKNSCKELRIILTPIPVKTMDKHSGKSPSKPVEKRKSPFKPAEKRKSPFKPAEKRKSPFKPAEKRKSPLKPAEKRKRVYSPKKYTERKKINSKRTEKSKLKIKRDAKSNVSQNRKELFTPFVKRVTIKKTFSNIAVNIDQEENTHITKDEKISYTFKEAIPGCVSINETTSGRDDDEQQSKSGPIQEGKQSNLQEKENTKVELSAAHQQKSPVKKDSQNAKLPLKPEQKSTLSIAKAVLPSTSKNIVVDYPILKKSQAAEIVQTLMDKSTNDSKTLDNARINSVKLNESGETSAEKISTSLDTIKKVVDEPLDNEAFDDSELVSLAKSIENKFSKEKENSDFEIHDGDSSSIVAENIGKQQITAQISNKSPLETFHYKLQRLKSSKEKYSNITTNSFTKVTLDNDIVLKSAERAKIVLVKPPINIKNIQDKIAEQKKIEEQVATTIATTAATTVTTTVAASVPRTLTITLAKVVAKTVPTTLTAVKQVKAAAPERRGTDGSKAITSPRAKVTEKRYPSIESLSERKGTDGKNICDFDFSGYFNTLVSREKRYGRVSPVNTPEVGTDLIVPTISPLRRKRLHEYYPTYKSPTKELESPSPKRRRVDNATPTSAAPVVVRAQRQDIREQKKTNVVAATANSEKRSSSSLGSTSSHSPTATTSIPTSISTTVSISKNAIISTNASISTTATTTSTSKTATISKIAISPKIVPVFKIFPVLKTASISATVSLPAKSSLSSISTIISTSSITPVSSISSTARISPTAPSVSSTTFVASTSISPSPSITFTSSNASTSPFASTSTTASISRISSTTSISSTVSPPFTSSISSPVTILSTASISSTSSKSITVPISSTSSKSITVPLSTSSKSITVPISSTSFVPIAVSIASTTSISSISTTAPTSSTIPISSTSFISKAAPISSTASISSLSSTSSIATTTPFSTTTALSSTSYPYTSSLDIVRNRGLIYSQASTSNQSSTITSPSNQKYFLHRKMVDIPSGSQIDACGVQFICDNESFTNPINPANIHFVRTNGEQHAESDQPFGDNVQVVYAAAAATMDPQDGGPPSKLRLLYAEAIGIQKPSEATKSDQVQLYYAATTPNQDVGTVPNPHIRLDHPRLICAAEIGAGEGEQLQVIIAPPQHNYVTNAVPLPVEVSYNGHTAVAQSVVRKDENISLISRARAMHHWYPSITAHPQYQLNQDYSSSLPSYQPQSQPYTQSSINSVSQNYPVASTYTSPISEHPAVESSPRNSKDVHKQVPGGPNRKWKGGNEDHNFSVPTDTRSYLISRGLNSPQSDIPYTNSIPVTSVPRFSSTERSRRNSPKTNEHVNNVELDASGKWKSTSGSHHYGAQSFNNSWDRKHSPNLNTLANAVAFVDHHANSSNDMRVRAAAVRSMEIQAESDAVARAAAAIAAVGQQAKLQRQREISERNFKGSPHRGPRKQYLSKPPNFLD